MWSIALFGDDEGKVDNSILLNIACLEGSNTKKVVSCYDILLFRLACQNVLLTLGKDGSYK